MQFLNLLWGHDLVGFINGTEACPPKHIGFGSLNPAYVVWQKKDICLLGWILASFLKKTCFHYWKHLSKSWLPCKLVSLLNHAPEFPVLNINFKRWLKVTNRVPNIFNMSKNLADQLVAAGKPVDDQDLISFLLGGLLSSYTPFVTTFNFASRETDYTFKDFQAELLGYENLLDVNHSIHRVDSSHFVFVANKSKAPTYVKKKGPPLPLAKLQNTSSSNYRPQQTRSIQTRSTP